MFKILTNHTHTHTHVHTEGVKSHVQKHTLGGTILGKKGNVRNADKRV